MFQKVEFLPAQTFRQEETGISDASILHFSCNVAAAAETVLYSCYIHELISNNISLKEKLITSALFKTINVPCSSAHLTWQAVRLNFILNLHHSDVTAAPCVVLHIQEA